MKRSEVPSSPRPLARHDSEPVFDEPWQAQALALAAQLQAQGLFSATEWSQALGDEIATATRAGEGDSAQSYYEAALRALEKLVASRTDVSEQIQTERVQQWREAYLHTPHGQPVNLEPGAG